MTDPNELPPLKERLTDLLGDITAGFDPVFTFLLLALVVAAITVVGVCADAGAQCRARGGVMVQTVGAGVQCVALPAPAAR